jgi:hypothetical protein
VPPPFPAGTRSRLHARASLFIAGLNGDLAPDLIGGRGFAIFNHEGIRREGWDNGEQAGGGAYEGFTHD